MQSDKWVTSRFIFSPFGRTVCTAGRTELISEGERSVADSNLSLSLGPPIRLDVQQGDGLLFRRMVNRHAGGPSAADISNRHTNRRFFDKTGTTGP